MRPANCSVQEAFYNNQQVGSFSNAESLLGPLKKALDFHASGSFTVLQIPTNFCLIFWSQIPHKGFAH